MTDQLLIIFVKNPVLGKCKTRLAKTLGDQKALAIYLKLLDYTRTFSLKIECDRHVYANEPFSQQENWPTSYFEHHVQCEGDLGAKMQQAFKKSFERGYQKVVIIGSDCAEINDKDLNKAFDLLSDKEVVIGPAEDGGYYLIGMNQLYPNLFSDKSWSTPLVLQETINSLKAEGINYGLLETRSDIDHEQDLHRKGYIDFEFID